ncbi:MAG: heavy metal translocating P-type ATPase [Deltaproteobacteria bacterium]|jgi:Cu2+-exporting ATPase|nr:heavy metal translocating P-type ATPase [Deltaproteobacteria bacterium]
MEGWLLTNLRGRLRLRLTPGYLSVESFERLTGRIMKIAAIKYCAFNRLSGSLLILYEYTEKAQYDLLSLVRDFRPSPARPTPWGQVTKFEAGEETPLPPNPVYGYILKRLLLPWPIRVAINILRAIPHLLKGLHVLLANHTLGVEVLDASALSVCLLRRDFNSAGTLLFFFALSEYLEAWTRRRSILGLYKSLSGPEEKVWIIDAEGQEKEIPESQLKVGHSVLAQSGGLIPVDGVVIEGLAMINQASMTGEPLPVKKEIGAAVFAGTTVEEGRVIIKATKVGRDSRIRSIIEYIRESENSKAGVQGRAERLADSIVPFNFLLFGLVFLITRDPFRAGNVLLVDYSCAIRLSTPLAVLSAMREGNERKVFIKGGRYIEELAEAEIICFDKTGTLTQAKPKLKSIIPYPPFSRDEAFRLAACLEEHFPHPVGRAVVAQAKAEGLRHEEEHTHVDYVLAHGIASTWRGHKVLLGSRHFLLEDSGIHLTEAQQAETEKMTEDGSSVIYMAVDGQLAALLAIEDSLRPGVTDTLTRLQNLGLKRAIMLTGDVDSSARAMASKMGFSEYKSELLPDQKAKYLKALVGLKRGVIMVGDGLNDSAALSLANVGVALSDGSELAKDVANIQLLSGRIEGLAVGRLLAQRTMARMRANFYAIVGFNTAVLALGLFGFLAPAMTAALHNAMTVYVAYRGTRPYLHHYEPQLEDPVGLLPSI